MIINVGAPLAAPVKIEINKYAGRDREIQRNFHFFLNFSWRPLHIYVFVIML